jgi:hypothetical protein
MLSSVMSQKFIEQLGSSRQSFRGCGKTRRDCHSQELQATRNLALC